MAAGARSQPSLQAGGTTPGPAIPTAAPALARASLLPHGEKDSFLDADLRHRLEDLLLEAGEAATPAALKQRLADAKYQGIQLSVVLGEPAHGIANFAEEKKAELIVIPSHGRTGITRLLIGSVAERVVRLAHCPVLVLRK